MTVHGFGVDAARTADAAQIGEEPLEAGLNRSSEFIRLFEAQTFKGELITAYCILRSARFEFFDQRVVSEEDDFDARVE